MKRGVSLHWVIKSGGVQWSKKMRGGGEVGKEEGGGEWQT